MRNPPTPAEAEDHIRRMLEESGLPQPDEVEHRPAELVLIYNEQKVAFTFELDDRWPDDPSRVLRTCADAWGDGSRRDPACSYFKKPS
jgi:hypothetical protein